MIKFDTLISSSSTWPMASGTSTLVTEEVTSHLLTNLWVIEQFLGPRFQVRGSRGERGVLTCRGAA